MSKANEPETVVLTDASGAERECICIDRLTVDGRVYVALIDEECEAGEYFIMEIAGEGEDGTTLEPIATDEEYDRIGEVFNEHLSQLYGEG
ncbi:MAG: DUF1292 domain-containing protein [Clostridia bacterium]|nr:DUF1292 domain-containing protein [Clostridia bacterium]MBP3937294.1 DUF1292 domain-containing protein [Clostridia bacterium]